MKTFSSFLILISTWFLESCTKPNTNSNTPPDNRTLAPVITGITPTQGLALSRDTIYGRNFSATTSDNIVTFNGASATVLNATTNQLIVTIPQNGTTGTVNVTVGGQVATGPIFTYTSAPNDSVMVTTIAGSGSFGSTDGPTASATFGSFWDLKIDSFGTIWVADGNHNRLRKISNGTVSSLIGLNTFPGQTQTSWIGLAFGANNLLYVTDNLGAPIRTVNPAGTVNNFVGNLFAGSTDGTGSNAYFRQPHLMVFDKASNLFVVDRGNNKIRKVTPSGVVTTFAGEMTGVGGWVDGTGTAAYFSSPQGLAIDKNDNLYVVDGSRRVRKITPAGVVTTIAGNDIGNYQDGFGLQAGIGSAIGIAVDNRTGNIYVSQNSNHRIRKIRPDGFVSTIAGTGAEGATDGPGRSASFRSPTALAVDSDGNLYVADGNNYKIRKITFK